MSEGELIVLLNKLDCVLCPGQNITEVYTLEDDDTLCVIAHRFKMVCFYDESILLHKLTPDKVKQKVENFKVRDKLAYIQERILKAKEDFE